MGAALRLATSASYTDISLRDWRLLLWTFRNAEAAAPPDEQTEPSHDSSDYGLACT